MSSYFEMEQWDLSLWYEMIKERSCWRVVRVIKWWGVVRYWKLSHSYLVCRRPSVITNIILEVDSEILT
ncbi:hypothetical protein ACS0TY_034527 [Phlomoides rotata]